MKKEGQYGGPFTFMNYSNHHYLEPGSEETAMDETDVVDAGSSNSSSSSRGAGNGVPLSSHVRTTLKEKSAPELGLASQDLEVSPHRVLSLGCAWIPN